MSSAARVSSSAAASSSYTGDSVIKRERSRERGRERERERERERDGEREGERGRERERGGYMYCVDSMPARDLAPCPQMGGVMNY